jgi:hypothetical protein
MRSYWATSAVGPRPAGPSITGRAPTVGSQPGRLRVCVPSDGWIWVTAPVGTL